MQYLLSFFLLFFISISCCAKDMDRQKATEIISQLTDLQKSITSSTEEINELKEQLQNSIDENEKTLLKMQLKEVRINLNQLDESFTTFVTGGVDFSKKDSVTKKFDWQKEIIEIVQPLIGELKDITNKPREIAKLKQILAVQKILVDKYKKALDNSRAIAKLNLPNKTNELVQKVIQKHQNSYIDAKRIYDVAFFKFKEKTTESESFLSSSNRKIQNFIKGRGLTLLLSFMAFAIIMLISYSIPKIFFSRNKKTITLGFYQRVAKLIYQAISFIFAISALLLVFYLRNDWALMGLAIIFIFFVILGLKNNVPKYLNDIKLLLNISTVREKERVVYQGIPWRVEKIGFFTTLINPQLQGGRIRIYLKDLANMHSRKYNKKEPWFPCKESDFVVLDDDTYGKVTIASPESVILQGYGGSIITYPTASFLEKRPLNLTQEGFSVQTIFGVDYGLQKKATTEIPQKFKTYISSAIKKQDYSEYFENIKLQFDVANSSSLDYFIFAKFKGAAAMYYRDIQRDLQKFATECCNENNWVIPFTQVTLHNNFLET
jgi:regulator of replication initiation timing